MARRWHKRRFFICDYESSPSGKRNIAGMEFETFSLESCRIWGFESDSEFDADHYQVDLIMKRGRIFGYWFSRNCPDGEVGSHAQENLVEITEEEFEKAMRSIKLTEKLKA